MILQNWWYTTLLGIQEQMRPPLEADLKTDVLVIGGGAAGLSAACRLMHQGLKVILLEKNICGGSSTGKSAGFLTPDSELELSQLIRRFGVKGARELWSVPVRGIEIMLGLVKKYEISCDLLTQDSLFLGIGSSGWEDIKEEIEARKKMGFDSQLYHREELSKIIGSTSYSGAVRYAKTYGVDALLYSQGLKHALLADGVQIFEASEVHSVKGHRAETHGGSVTADQIIFCADKLKPRISRFAANVYHAQTFLSISEPITDREFQELFPSGPLQCWDSTLVYSYFRPTGDQRLLLGGGSMLTTFSRHDHTEPNIIERVIGGFKKRFPKLTNLQFIQYWPGRIDTTRDLLPTVARDPNAPHIHFVLGCVGLPWATFCGDFAARHAIDNHWEDDHYYQYFRDDRMFFMSLAMEKIFGKQIVFSLNNAWAKYYQVDQKKLCPKKEASDVS